MIWPQGAHRAQERLPLRLILSKRVGLLGPASTTHQIYDRNTELLELRRVRRVRGPHWFRTVPLELRCVHYGRPREHGVYGVFLCYSRTTIVHLYRSRGSSGIDVHTQNLAHRLERHLRVASGRVVSFHATNLGLAMLRMWPVGAPDFEEPVINTRFHLPLGIP